MEKGIVMQANNIINSEPKILVISNNAFSTTNNNGKTLASFFKDFNSDNIAQLYFNSEFPSDRYFENFYQISDSSLLKSIIFRNNKSGGIVTTIDDTNNFKLIEKNIVKDACKTIVVNSNLARLMREFLWRIANWKSVELTNWIEEFSPDIIFFCAGDSEFTYRIVNTLKSEYKTKLVTYITDDYVLPRKTMNLLWWIRRSKILKKLKKTLEVTDLFFTISEKMSKVYTDFLGKKSMVLINMSGSLKNNITTKINQDNINLVYTGGLHMNRHKTLIMLSKAIQKYNKYVSGDMKKVFLSIYSNNKPPERIIKKLNVTNASKFCGKLNSEQLIDVLNQSDIPVHVESFDKKSIDATFLSISTKIPEYLSLEKPVLAIGPKEVASMQILKDVAFCINNPNNVFEDIKPLFRDSKLRSELSNHSKIKYENNFDVKNNIVFFRQEIMKLFDATT